MAGNPALGRRAYVRCKALREGGAEEGGREGEARAREIEKVGESERCVFVLPEVQYNLLRRDRAGGEVLCVCMYTGCPDHPPRASARKLHDFSLSMTHDSHSPTRDSAETPYSTE